MKIKMVNCVEPEKIVNPVPESNQRKIVPTPISASQTKDDKASEDFWNRYLAERAIDKAKKKFYFPIKGQEEGYNIPEELIQTLFEVNGGTLVLLKDMARVGDAGVSEFITTLGMQEIKKGLGWS